MGIEPILVFYTLLSNYVDFITANPKVLNLAGFVSVLATPQDSFFFLIMVKNIWYEVIKRKKSLFSSFLNYCQISCHFVCFQLSFFFQIHGNYRPSIPYVAVIPVICSITNKSVFMWRGFKKNIWFSYL